jgi:hypothetical protein
MKFPVYFPVSREFGSGDGFESDCVRHYAVSKISGVREFTLKAPKNVGLNCHEKCLGPVSFPKTSSAADSCHDTESAHHPTRCLRSSVCS